jgi:1-acyl-sn-glycerol-3-phosphate acyltransferase
MSTSTHRQGTKRPAVERAEKRAVAERAAMERVREQELPRRGEQPEEPDPGSKPGGLRGLVAARLETAREKALQGPNEGFLEAQKHILNFVADHYFRVEFDGWHRVPDENCLVVGVHSGGALTMDAWMLVHGWWRRFGTERFLHATAHDVLMAAPVLGEYFRLNGVVPASRRGVTAALADGRDVVVWPGGEQDSMRSWRKRDKATLAGRKGFVRQALRSQVPILPVATIGGHDTVFVLSEGRWIADLGERLLGLKSKLRGATLPITLGLPFGIAPEILPTHIPLPAKIRTELLEPIRLDADPERADDKDYVKAVYREVETAIQDGMDRLAKRRSFPICG